MERGSRQGREFHVILSLHDLNIVTKCSIFDTMAKCFVSLIVPAQDKHGKLLQTTGITAPQYKKMFTLDWRVS